jgi:hypothetical protein
MARIQETPSFPSLKREPQRATQSGLCGDPHAVLSGDATGKSCQRGYCRRHHCCIAEAGPGACLGRHWPLLTRAEQEAAHFEVIDGGPQRVRPQTSAEWSLRRFPPSNFVHG